ncbi:MAG: pantoate--beta-alanine ligase [Dysgonamonadaceae bacterium]|jgi:pantoate--beta-alanine ligase|nr:pantoate--beta-alanine ligase [Dysgonamonadaceae bacterium]
MKVITTIASLNEALAPYRFSGASVGFVPTMGALHEGHATLVRQCVAENKVCVVSIFVNPTQFNNKEDLRLYPRTLETDCELLEQLGATFVFVPSEEEVYPETDTRVFDFGALDKVMEGRFRPGHFNGVAQVVSKLFEMVKPDTAYFGEKDFQQLAIVRAMVKQLDLPVRIVGVPIVREPSGLAMSSRNQRLLETEKISAAEIYRTLKKSVTMTDTYTPAQIIDSVINKINNVSGLCVEYYEIVDGNSLQSISSWQDSNYIVGCIAVFCGDVRLIDNIEYK